MQGHTKGPWEVEAAYHQGARVIKGREGWIARVEGYGPETRRDPEQDANARLIAAAPDLLAALGAIRARVNGEFDHPELMAFGPLSTDTAADCSAIAARALARVRGEG